MWDWLQTALGSVSDGDYSKLPQVARVDQGAYQMPGFDQYLAQVGGLGQKSGQIQIDPRAANAQYANLGQLQSYANGTAPSAAQLQLQGQRQQMLQGMQATALSNQAGVNPALAYRGLLGAQATADQNMGAVAAQQRAGEQAQAQSQYANTLAGMRSQATNEAGFQSGQVDQQGRLLGQGFAAQQYDQRNRQAYNDAQIGQTMNDRNQQYQRAQNNAAAWGTLTKGLMGAGAAALGGGLGMMAAPAAQAGGAALGGAFSSLGQGRGGYVDPYSYNSTNPGSMYGPGR